jgi:hypothetical protein
VRHGFNNEATPRYDAEAAKLAWVAARRAANYTLDLTVTNGSLPA